MRLSRLFRIAPLLFLAAYSSSFAIDKRAGLSEAISQSYPEIRDLSLRILERYPSAEGWSFLFLGQSPTEFAGFFDELGVQNAAQMPLSGMTDFPKKGPMPEAEQRAKLWSHFERWLPLQAKKVLVIDFTAGGGGLTHTQKELEAFLEQRKKKGLPAFELRMLALSSVDWGKRTGVNPGVDSLLISPQLEKAFTYSSFDQWSKYGSFYPWKDSETSIRVRPEYGQLGQKLQALMRSDSHLREALSAACLRTIASKFKVF